MRKRYSLIKLLDGVRTISDLTRAIAELTYLKNQVLISFLKMGII